MSFPVVETARPKPSQPPTTAGLLCLYETPAHLVKGREREDAVHGFPGRPGRRLQVGSVWQPDCRCRQSLEVGIRTFVIVLKFI